MEDHHTTIVQGCASQAATTFTVLLRLSAERRATCKPGRGPAQVDRQLPGAEVAILGQAAMDRGLGDQHCQAHGGCLRTRVRPAAPCSLLANRIHARSAAASRGRSGFQLANRPMAAIKAAASSSATATATTSPPTRGDWAATAGGSGSDGGMFLSILGRAALALWNRSLTDASPGPGEGTGHHDQRPSMAGRSRAILRVACTGRTTWALPCESPVQRFPSQHIAAN